ncbi:MAG: hypothetical protein IPM23_02890 [Candidatus Melainabacteria bacterium]|nr:hypothetical protein [Candidatus Melainabacteria bacterium]
MMIKTLILLLGLYLAAFAGNFAKLAIRDQRLSLRRRVCLTNSFVLVSAIIASICGYRTACFPLLYGSVAVAIFATTYRFSR